MTVPRHVQEVVSKRDFPKIDYKLELVVCQLNELTVGGRIKLEACEGKEGRSICSVWFITYKQFIDYTKLALQAD